MYIQIKIPVYFTSPQIKSLFGVRGKNVDVYTDAKLSNKLSNTAKVSELSSKTLYVGASGATGGPSVPSPICNFANVQCGGNTGTMLLENPQGTSSTVENLRCQV